MSTMIKSKYSKFFTAILLAFLPVFSASAALATPLTPAQQLAALQADLQAYTTQFNQYNLHYQTYAPGLISELDPASTALTAFGADVNILQSAINTLSQDALDLATAQANLANQPSVISTTAASVDVARAAYDIALATYTPLHTSYTTALAERDAAYTAYQNTAQGGTVTETFTNRVLNTQAQFLVNGTTALSTNANAGYSITNNEYSGTYMSGGSIKAYWPTGSLKIIPPSQTSTTFFQFATGALNGNMTSIVTYTDGSTGTLLAPNGVYSGNQGNSYTLTQGITAPSGKYIASITIPAYSDWYYMDNFVFTSSVYDATAYQTYLDKQAAYDEILAQYTPAATAYNTAVSNLSLAETTYNTARDASTTAALQALVDSEQATYDASSTAVQTAITNALASKEVIATALAAVVLPPDSMEVTSTSDEYVPGTLRWAITQTNALSGSIYDRIKFKIQGTITLTSDLPRIYGNLTIEGLNKNTTKISGNDQFRIFYINPGITLTANNLTLQDGKQTSGGMVFQDRGNFNSTAMRFTGQNGGSAVFIANSGVATYHEAEFTNNEVGIAADWGSTPQLPEGVTTWADQPDTVFQNRTYIYNSTFSNNSSAIDSYRFTYIEGSTFTNNQYAANITGLNRTQIKNSTFENNSVAYYNNVWMPVGFNMGTDNRLIQNNIFKNNGTAIYNDDGYNNGQKFPGWSTFTGNTFINNPTIVRYYKWNGTSNQEFSINADVASATTPITDFVFAENSVPILQAPTNIAATSNEDGSVTVNWTPALALGTTVERYAVSWTTEGANGWGVASSTTSITLPRDIFATTGGLDKTYTFTVRADNDTLGVYSPTSNTVTAEVTAPPVPVIPVVPPVVPPVVVPTPQPTIDPTPEPTQTPTPEPTETAQPTPEPTTEPSPEPTSEPTKEPVVEPTPEPEKEVIKAEDLPEVISAELLSKIDLTAIVATDLSPAQADALVEAAMETFQTAEKGSAEYEQALDALMVAAKQDDIVVDPAIAAIPLLGNAVQGLTDALNFMSNVGADMSPQTREESGKIVVSAVVAGQVAQMAMTASMTINVGTPPTPSAPSAPSAPKAPSSPSAPSSGGATRSESTPTRRNKE
jgi:hypothetical protein